MPIKKNELAGIIVSKGLSQKDLAKKIGMTPNTFYSKMSKGIFGSDEIERMIDVLDIKNPVEIFFTKDVT